MSPPVTVHGVNHPSSPMSVQHASPSCGFDRDRRMHGSFVATSRIVSVMPEKETESEDAKEPVQS
jgi:hypothetical protein